MKSYQLKHLNIRLLLFVAALCVLGINVISSATDDASLPKKQVLGIILGGIVMVLATIISYQFVLKFYWVIFVVNFGMLIAVRLFGSVHMGAQRWIDLGSIQLQPSELTKLFIIIFMAKFIQKHKEKLNTIWVILAIVGTFAVPAFLVLKQPDLSTTIVLVMIFCSILFAAGLSYKIIGGVVLAAIPVAVVMIYLILQPDQKILEPYQYNRIIGFYDENNTEAARINYQQINSEMAIGSGGLFGKGLNNNTITSVKNGNYISEPQTDFIFCIIGEELGFVGSAGVIILLAMIVLESFYVGAHAPDMSGKLLCTGFGAWILFQSFINIAVVTRMIPNTGLTLPFVSYGLSSLISLFAGIGMVLNVGLQHKKGMLGGN